jgi:hypothetical protein
VLPEGWQYRLNQVRDPITLADGYCLDPTDMAASKLVAWREKDKEFLGAMLESQLIDRGALEQRALQIPQKRLSEYGLTHEELVQRIGLVGQIISERPLPDRATGNEPSTIEGMRRALPLRKKSKGLDR